MQLGREATAFGAMADTAHGGQPPAARGPHACRLALKLVDEALGPVCRQVIACLIDHGMQQVGGPSWRICRVPPLATVAERRTSPAAAVPSCRHPGCHPWAAPCVQYGELVRVSGLPAGQLRAALLVLIQHNYVNCYHKEEPPTLRGPGPAYFLYEAALPRILQSLRCDAQLAGLASQAVASLDWQHAQLPGACRCQTASYAPRRRQMAMLHRLRMLVGHAGGSPEWVERTGLQPSTPQAGSAPTRWLLTAVPLAAGCLAS